MGCNCKKEVYEGCLNNRAYTLEIKDSSDSIEMSGEVGSLTLGKVDILASKITIRDGLNPSLFLNTVIHELIHFSLFAGGYHIDDEEAMCDFFAINGVDIMAEAKKIVSWNMCAEVQ